MGFIRGGLFVIVSVLFFISLLLAGSLFVVTSSLDYENLRQELIPVLKQTLNEKINITSLIEEDKYPLMQQFCANSSQELEYVFTEENYTFSIPCSVLSGGPSEVVNLAVDNLFHEYYYKEYDCNFFDCIEKDSIPFFLVSEHSRDYWQGNFYYMILAAFVLLVLMFFLIEKKTNLPLVAGPLMIVSSLPFMKLESFFSFIPGEFLKYLTLVFNQSYKAFLIMLIAGLAVLALGFVLKFFAIGFKINEFFSRFGSQKEAGKKEPEKQDKKKIKPSKK